MAYDAQKHDEFIRREERDLYNRAKQTVEQNPYRPYGGQRFAGFNADQQRGFGLARQNVGAYQPYLNQARSFAQQGAQQFSAADANRLMNPYMQAVGQQVVRDINRAFDQQALLDSDAARAAGAFGGSRHGVVDAERNRNRAQEISDTLTQLYSGAYDRALNAYEAERQRMANAANQFAGLGQQAQQQGLVDAQSQLDIGRAQQALEQAYLDFLFEEYQRQQNAPFDQINFLRGILGGSPYTGQDESDDLPKWMRYAAAGSQIVGNIGSAATSALGL